LVRASADALDATAAGERIAADIEARDARVRAAAGARRTSGQAPVRWAYLIWRHPWMAVSGDTFVSALLDAAGGANVFAGSAARYPTITPAELAAADPARVFLSSEPFPFTAAHADELAGESGLPRDRFRLVDGELLSWHGSRTPSGIDYAERLVVVPEMAATPG
jgi:ABC-type Fe3+-hydroxamate transport system substrate-binding protein